MTKGIRINIVDGVHYVDARSSVFEKYKQVAMSHTAAGAIVRAAELLGIRAISGDEADMLTREADMLRDALATVRSELGAAWPAITEDVIQRVETVCDVVGVLDPSRPVVLSSCNSAGLDNLPDVETIMSVTIPAGAIGADEVGMIESRLRDAESRADRLDAISRENFDKLQQWQAACISAEKQRDELLAALVAMNSAYVNLMENARCRIVSLGGSCDPVDVMERHDPNLRDSRAAIASAKGGTQLKHEKRAAEKQRDELLAACEDALENGSDGDWQSARKILAKAISDAKVGAA